MFHQASMTQSVLRSQYFNEYISETFNPSKPQVRADSARLQRRKFGLKVALLGRASWWLPGPAVRLIFRLIALSDLRVHQLAFD
jgi:hypothetical protein